MDCLIGFRQGARGKKNPYVIMPFGCLSGPGPTASEAPLALARGPLATPWVPEHPPGLPGPCRRQEPPPSAALDPGRGQRAPLSSCRHAGDQGWCGRAAWTVRVGGAGRRMGAGPVGGMAGVAGLRGGLSRGRARRAFALEDGQGRPEATLLGDGGANEYSCDRAALPTCAEGQWRRTPSAQGSQPVADVRHARAHGRAQG